MLPDAIDIKLNLCPDDKIVRIRSNDECFLAQLKSFFFNHVLSYEGKADINISADFGLPLNEFISLSQVLTSARCGLLIDTSCEVLNFRLFSLFKSKELYKAAFREIRSYLDDFIINQDILTLHAACVSDDRGAVCIIGDKFAGKTTLMLKLLSLSFSFLSNDKPYIYLSGSDFYAFSLPVSAGIRFGSIGIFPHLKEAIQSKSSSDNVEFSPNGRVHLSPNILCDIFKVNYRPHSKVRKFIYLSTDYTNMPVLTDNKINLQGNILACKNASLRDKFANANIKICRTYDEALYEIIN
ncbi:hypothetical protein ID853_02955 [Xenorhabdus sp. Vera]|uniref:hypothetical protein n=1 Tax=Xenorhabdus koppenhoeferi TaxID=351659 RepID=UPI0019987EEE|nr:hypothetical protein [Xenorhabdus sp. Vera]MBD2809866.1 hypothetical protein [Xenorhabdus sp. Vera]